MTIRQCKPKLIVLAQDAGVTAQIAQLARPYYQVVATPDPRWATAWLGQYRDVSVFLAAQDLAGPNLALFHRAQAMRSDVLRIVISADVQQQTILEAFRRGAVHHVLGVPLDEIALADMICSPAVAVVVSPHRVIAG